MKKVSEVVQRVGSHYVGDDCVQVMVPCEKIIAILNKDGIIYYHNKAKGSCASINKYTDDERRKQFPYSNIPTHYSKVGLFDKINYANQLLNFEEPYIRIDEDGIIEVFAIKDRNEALIINKVLTGDIKSVYVTRKELEEVFSNSTTGKEKKWIICLNDKFINIGENPHLSSEERIYDFVKSQITEVVTEFRHYTQNNSSSMVGQYLLEHPVFLDFVGQSIKDLDLNKIKTDIVLRGGEAIILKSNGSDMTIQYVFAHFISLDNYRIDMVDIPVNKYTLEQLKNISPKIVKTKKTRISLKLNPDISKEDIQKAKQMVKSLE